MRRQPTGAVAERQPTHGRGGEVAEADRPEQRPVRDAPGAGTEVAVRGALRPDDRVRQGERQLWQRERDDHRPSKALGRQRRHGRRARGGRRHDGDDEGSTRHEPQDGQRRETGRPHHQGGKHPDHRVAVGLRALNHEDQTQTELEAVHQARRNTGREPIHIERAHRQTRERQRARCQSDLDARGPHRDRRDGDRLQRLDRHRHPEDHRREQVATPRAREQHRSGEAVDRRESGEQGKEHGAVGERSREVGQQPARASRDAGRWVCRGGRGGAGGAVHRPSRRAAPVCSASSSITKPTIPSVSARSNSGRSTASTTSLATATMVGSSVEGRLAERRAVDLQLWDPDRLEALDEHEIDRGHAGEVLLERRLRRSPELVREDHRSFAVSSTCVHPASRCRYESLPAVVDVEGLVGVLDDRDGQAASREGRHETLDEGGLAASAPPGDAEGPHLLSREPA